MTSFSTIVTDIAGQSGIIPRTVYINTNASLSDVTTLNFLKNSESQGFSYKPTDLFYVSYYGDVSQLFTCTITDSGITLVPAYITPSNTSGQVISASTSSATPGIIRALTGNMTSTATVMTSGNIVGVRGSVTCVGASGGFIYGTQGKVISTGTLSSSVWVSGLFGQLDVSSATITSGQLAAVWADYGTTASAGTYAGARLYAGTNTTAAILNSNLYLYGAATNIFELVDNNALSGPTYFVNAGTSAGSAGDTSKCNASKVLKITVNGTNYWIPLFASNS